MRACITQRAAHLHTYERAREVGSHGREIGWMTRAKRAEPGTAPSCWGRVRCVDCTGSREARALGKSDASPCSWSCRPSGDAARYSCSRGSKVSIRIDRIQRFKVYAWRLVPPPGPACSAVYNRQLYASRARAVARNSSNCAFDAVAALRAQHKVDYDVPGAYLQGEQLEHERRVYRPPVGFRAFDERGA